MDNDCIDAQTLVQDQKPLFIRCRNSHRCRFLASGYRKFAHTDAQRKASEQIVDSIETGPCTAPHERQSQAPDYEFAIRLLQQQAQQQTQLMDVLLRLTALMQTNRSTDDGQALATQPIEPPPGLF